MKNKIEEKNKKYKKYLNIIEQYNDYLNKIKNPDIENCANSINSVSDFLSVLVVDIKLILEDDKYGNYPIINEKFVCNKSIIEKLVAFINEEIEILNKTLCNNCSTCRKYKYQLNKRALSLINEIER